MNEIILQVVCVFVYLCDNVEWIHIHTDTNGILVAILGGR